MSLLQQGSTLEQVSATIAGSSEYIAARGAGTTAGSIGALYHDLLGRASEEAGRGCWLTLPEAGVAREEVARQIGVGLEGSLHKAEELYQEVLQRTGDADGRTYRRQLLRTSGVDAVWDPLQASNECFARYCAPDAAISPSQTQAAAPAFAPDLADGRDKETASSPSAENKVDSSACGAQLDETQQAVLAGYGRSPHQATL